MLINVYNNFISTENCPICHETMENTDCVAHSKEGIKHPLHRKCMEQWMKIAKNCPTCRKEVFNWEEQKIKLLTKEIKNILRDSLSGITMPLSGYAFHHIACLLYEIATETFGYRAAGWITTIALGIIFSEILEITQKNLPGNTIIDHTSKDSYQIMSLSYTFNALINSPNFALICALFIPISISVFVNAGFKIRSTDRDDDLDERHQRHLDISHAN